ncbi:hypothetical protein AALK94_08995 [Bacteroides faecichinchillae]|uniref:hypothetical protein n=1 Tax=Bacteroides faecichinchillae TaxID=871325 RepID=UPI0035182A67
MIVSSGGDHVVRAQDYDERGNEILDVKYWDNRQIMIDYITRYGMTMRMGMKENDFTLFSKCF